MAGATPSQTVGPFFSFGLCVNEQNRLVDPGDEGAIELRGRVLDGDGRPVPDAMVEIWQRDAAGAAAAGIRLGPVGYRRRWRFPVRHGQTWRTRARPTSPCWCSREGC